jgi:hypothetical protein
MAKVKGWVASD